jgi:ArsR family transcriptional regulator
VPTKPEPRKHLSLRELRAISRALADPGRFAILQRVARQTCAACSDLRTVLPISAATLSHHLKELESAGLLQTERRGKYLDVTFDRPTWNAYLNELQKL